MKFLDKKTVALIILTVAAGFAVACAAPSVLQNESEKPSAELKSEKPSAPEKPAAKESSTQNDGGYYLDDGPPLQSRPLQIVAVVPRVEKINPAHNRPYTALGKKFRPHTAVQKYKKRGVASWYGRRYHGNKTSSGEVYDMFKLSAAHPILAIPSYVRVTRVATGKSITVRVNDRGPFLQGREIDLSFAAAHLLGYVKAGTTEVVVEAIIPRGVSAKASTNSLQNSARDSLSDSPSDILPVYIQLGAFSSRRSAETLRNKFLQFIAGQQSVHLTAGSDKLYRVKAGPYENRRTAKKYQQQWCKQGWCGVLVNHL